jgi:hypothetical protein
VVEAAENRMVPGRQSSSFTGRSMRAVRSFIGVVLTLGIIGWLNAAPSREVGSDMPDSSPIAASVNWIKGMPTRSREIPHAALRVAQSDPI